MRELILLRHAHAEPPAPGQEDFDRPLSLQGQAEAEAAGRWLKEHGYTPDRVVCSTARRTRETTEQALAARTGDSEFAVYLPTATPKLCRSLAASCWRRRSTSSMAPPALLALRPRR